MYFASLNRNKRSVHIDLTTDEGQAELGDARRDRARAAREPAAVDDPQARARLRVAAPVQPEDRLRRAHRLRARRPGGRVARVRLRDPGDHRRRGDDGRARRTARRSPATRRSTTRRGSWPRSGSWRRCSRARAARSTSRSSTSCSRSSTTRPRPTSTAAACPTRQPLGAHTFYVPAQLFETASGYLALFVTHDEFWRRLCVEIGRAGVGRRPALRDDARAVRAPRRAARRARRGACEEAPAAEWVGATPAARDRGRRGGRPRRRARRRPRARAGAWWCRSTRADGPAAHGRQPDPDRTDARPEYRVPPRLHEHTARGRSARARRRRDHAS